MNAWVTSKAISTLFLSKNMIGSGTSWLSTQTAEMGKRNAGILQFIFHYCILFLKGHWNPLGILSLPEILLPISHFILSCYNDKIKYGLK